MTACELKAFDNKTVRITFLDGEVATARLTCTGEGCEDVMVDIVATNRPHRYAHRNCTYIVPASELVSVTDIASSPILIEAPDAAESASAGPQLVEPPTPLEESAVEPLAA